MKGVGETVSPPKPFSENLIDIIMLFSERWNISPFDVLQKDVDDFIIISNYLMSMDIPKEEKTKKNITKKETRIRVNDKTATGGWF